MRLLFKSLVSSRASFRFFSQSTTRELIKVSEPKFKNLITKGFPIEILNMCVYLKSLPVNSKLHQEFKSIDEYLSQISEAYNSLQSERPDSDDFKFYQSELEETTSVVKQEHERILHELVEQHFGSEGDKVEGAILEFRAGVGGSEALLFAEEMSEHYQHYLSGKGFRIEGISSTKQGGKVIAFKAKGRGVYSHILHESGVHKVIRVPETEAKGRLHSSTISIVVLPDVPFEFRLNEKDLKFEFMRSQGPGGQHVNKTESACRVTHLPTGTTVMMQDERCQITNKLRAVELLREKLYQQEFAKKENEEMAKRKVQIGTADRSDKIRTFNFPQDRITDHRLGKTVFGIQQHLISGKLFEECIEEMQKAEFENSLKEFNQMLNERITFE